MPNKKKSCSLLACYSHCSPHPHKAHFLIGVYQAVCWALWRIIPGAQLFSTSRGNSGIEDTVTLPDEKYSKSYDQSATQTWQKKKRKCPNKWRNAKRFPRGNIWRVTGIYKKAEPTLLEWHAQRQMDESTFLKPQIIHWDLRIEDDEVTELYLEVRSWNTWDTKWV